MNWKSKGKFLKSSKEQLSTAVHRRHGLVFGDNSKDKIRVVIVFVHAGVYARQY